MEGLAAFFAVSAVVICTPGQDTALTVRNTLGGGRSCGIATAAGVAAGQAVWTVAASLGVVAVLTASEPAFRVLKLAGAAYLVALGVASLYAALRPRGGRGGSHRPGEATGPVRAWRQGVVSNLGNPKMAVFFASLLPQFAGDGGGASLVTSLVLGFVFCLMTLSWLSFYAAAVAVLRRLLAGPVRRAVDAVTGLALVLLGLRLATGTQTD